MTQCLPHDSIHLAGGGLHIWFPTSSQLTAAYSLKPKSNNLPLVEYSLSIVKNINPVKILNMKQQYKATPSAKMCSIGGKVILQRSPWLGQGKAGTSQVGRAYTSCIKRNASLSKQQEKSRVKFIQSTSTAHSFQQLCFLPEVFSLSCCETKGDMKLVKNEMPLRVYCTSTSALRLQDPISFSLQIKITCAWFC